MAHELRSVSENLLRVAALRPQRAYCPFPQYRKSHCPVNALLGILLGLRAWSQIGHANMVQRLQRSVLERCFLNQGHGMPAMN